jgi:hypothetical protein
MSEFLAYWLQRTLLELVATKVDLVLTQKKVIDANFRTIAMQQRLLCEQQRRIDAERAHRASLKDEELKPKTVTFRTKPKNLTLNIHKESGMNGEPYIVELVEELADGAKDNITIRFENETLAEKMARDLMRLLANAELVFDAEKA